jgi:Flp pilus assembly pilin Flp
MIEHAKTAAGVLLCVMVARAVATVVTLLEVALKVEFHDLGKSARIV